MTDLACGNGHGLSVEYQATGDEASIRAMFNTLDPNLYECHR